MELIAMQPLRGNLNYLDKKITGRSARRLPVVVYVFGDVYFRSKPMSWR